MGLFKANKNDLNCKFISIDSYLLKDSLQYSKRRYRNVFDEGETNYLYFDIHVQNKLFLIKDWEATFNFKITNLDSKNEFAKFVEKKTISRNEPTFNIRSGYGKEKGGYWKEGHFKVQCYLKNILLGSTEFYIFNKGLPTNNFNPYFNLYGFKLYLCPDGIETDKTRKNRTFYTTFKEDDLFYLGVEILVEPKIKTGIYPSQFRLYINEIDGTQKAVWNSSPLTIESKLGNRMLSLHWGNKEGSFWKKGTYIIYLHFMDVLIGVTEFKVSNNSLIFSGQNMLDEVLLQNSYLSGRTSSGTSSFGSISFEEAKKELQDLIGLNKVKEEINELSTFLQYVKIRADKGIVDKAINTEYLVFTGNPGTGKTTVAKLLGKIYKSLGILSSGHLIEVGRAELIASFIGQTAPKVKKVIEQARGGVLFIDEAYSLARKGESEKDFGKEAIEILMKEMSDGKGNLVIVYAGYPDEMKEFVNSNPGIRSRISQFIHFDDYTPIELFKIGMYSCNKKSVELTKEAQTFFQEKLYEAYRVRDSNFGNARYVISVIQEAKTQLAMRVMKNKKSKELNKKELSTITLKDIAHQFEKDDTTSIDIPIDKKLLEESLNELNELIGLLFIKEEIYEVIKLVKYYRKIGKDFRKDFSLHQVFTGNPGTGKTTLARILVKIYKALGILERGHLVEVDRSELVASFTGQTAPKTDKVVDDSIGGMLFIDEAYSLVIHGDSFGEEAIETLLKRMEDDRGKFVIIAAGYTKQMKKFLESNPGLNSRFDRIWNFLDYTIEELLAIGELFFSHDGLIMNSEAKAIFNEKLTVMKNSEGSSFGNARSVRRIVDEVKKNQLLRMAENETEKPTQKDIETVLAKDFDNLSASKIKSKGTLGFK